jgi:hypothetical protein
MKLLSVTPEFMATEFSRSKVRRVHRDFRISRRATREHYYNIALFFVIRIRLRDL